MWAPDSSSLNQESNFSSKAFFARKEMMIQLNMFAYSWIYSYAGVLESTLMYYQSCVDQILLINRFWNYRGDQNTGQVWL